MLSVQRTVVLKLQATKSYGPPSEYAWTASVAPRAATDNTQSLWLGLLPAADPIRMIFNPLRSGASSGTDVWLGLASEAASMLSATVSYAKVK